MFKFSLGDKVFIKSLEKQATITGMRWEQTSSQPIKVSYELFYEVDHWNESYMVPAYSEYLGKKSVYVRALEKDLEGIFDRFAPKGLLRITNDDITKEDVLNMRAAWDSVVVKKDGVVIPTGKYPGKIATWKGWVDAVDENIGKIKEGNTPDDNDRCDALHYVLQGLAPKYGIDPASMRRQEISSAEACREWSNPCSEIHYFPNEEGHCDDHLDALRYVSYALEPKGIDSCEIVVDLDNIKTACDHTWLPYEGLTQKYDYCEKCDVKKS